MPRLSRLVVPGYPHHITQRGVRSMDIFTDDQDRFSYLQFMAEESNRFGVTFLGWCLMTNHVHLIAIPESKLPQMVNNWPDFLVATDEETERNLRKKTRAGRPAGDDRFVLRLEVLSGRTLRMSSPGRRRKLE